MATVFGHGTRPEPRRTCPCTVYHVSIIRKSSKHQQSYTRQHCKEELTCIYLTFGIDVIPMRTHCREHGYDRQIFQPPNRQAMVV
jgi:hypothetical protein